MQADDVNGVDIELRDLRLAVVMSQHRSLRRADAVPLGRRRRYVNWTNFSRVSAVGSA